MGRKTFTVEDHERAFAIYYETRVWTRVTEALDCAGQTVYNWSKSEYKCPYGCPWHDWDKLIADKDRLMAVHSQLIEDGNLDPLAHDRASRNHLDVQKPRVNRRAAILQLMTSDLERLQHLQILYNKLYYEMTGVQLGLDITGGRYGGKDLVEIYKQGLKCETTGEAMRCFKMICDEIDKIRLRNNALDSQQPEEENVDKKPLTLAELRNIKDRLAQTSPDQMEMLRSTLAREEIVATAVQHGK